MNTFASAGVPASLIDALAALGITTPTPIQAATLPDSLAGRDVLGRGRTGSGKTYAFLLPLVAALKANPRKPAGGRPRALILAPTRELVAQIDSSLAHLTQGTPLRSLTIFGGVSQVHQVAALTRGVDIVIACPGRLEDLMQQGHVRLDDVEISVLDEADHMADLGFLPGVKRILDKTPNDGQRMLFSATLDAGVDVLVKRYLHQPVTHEADSEQSPVDTMEHHVLHVAHDAHLPVLLDLAAAPGRTIVFTRTKHRAKKLARQLNAAGVPTVELHGNLSQNARTRTMDAFHGGSASTLVATDIAARGIHVDDVALVVHADPPMEHKAYLHRSGRTARAGNEGRVITLVMDEQRRDVSDLMRKAGISPTSAQVTATHPLLAELAPGVREFPGGISVATPEQQRRAGAPAAGGGSRRRSGGGGGARRGNGGGQPKDTSGNARNTSAPRSGGARTQSSRSTATAGSGTHSAAAFSCGGSGGRGGRSRAAR